MQNTRFTAALGKAKMTRIMLTVKAHASATLINKIEHCSYVPATEKRCEPLMVHRFRRPRIT